MSREQRGQSLSLLPYPWDHFYAHQQCFLFHLHKIYSMTGGTGYGESERKLTNHVKKREDFNKTMRQEKSKHHQTNFPNATGL
jgi:hypothetical protein